MSKIVLAFAASMLPICPAIADDLPGTCKLISSTRMLLETGEVRDSYGKHPNGDIMYGDDGRMLVLITHEDRSKPPRAEMTDQDRADQFHTMNAYGGTYTFHGEWIEHHIDIAASEARVGTTEIRQVKRDGNRLIYTTRPQPFSADGKMSVITLVWEKMAAAAVR